MTSTSIRVRVDDELWASAKLPSESDTALGQRLLKHYLETKQLTQIDPNPVIAVAKAVQAHQLLERASVAITLTVAPNQTAQCQGSEEPDTDDAINDDDF